MAYYYLVAQLPHLVYGQPAPITEERFMTLCRDSLSASDLASLAYCSLVPGKSGWQPTGIGFIDQWRNWEMALRTTLVRYRAQKVKREGILVEIPECSIDVAPIAKAAIAIESPLEAELFLDQARWNAIETFCGLDYFSVNTIYGYLLKLLLLERRSLFKLEEGFAEYKGLYAAIMAGASKVES